jgi:hypothetical protein
VKGIAWQVPVKIARERGEIVVNLYDEGRMTAAVRRACKRKALVRLPSPNGRAVFKAAQEPLEP